MLGLFPLSSIICVLGVVFNDFIA